jgi:hypothetical protein
MKIDRQRKQRVDAVLALISIDFARARKKALERLAERLGEAFGEDWKPYDSAVLYDDFFLEALKSAGVRDSESKLEVVKAIEQRLGPMAPLARLQLYLREKLVDFIAVTNGDPAPRGAALPVIEHELRDHRIIVQMAWDGQQTVFRKGLASDFFGDYLVAVFLDDIDGIPVSDFFRCEECSGLSIPATKKPSRFCSNQCLRIAQQRRYKENMSPEQLESERTKQRQRYERQIKRKNPNARVRKYTKKGG